MCIRDRVLYILTAIPYALWVLANVSIGMILPILERYWQVLAGANTGIGTVLLIPRSIGMVLAERYWQY